MLEVLPSSCSKILVLVMRLALPIIDAQGAQNILDTSRYLNCSTVASELVHCSPFADDILEGVDKLGRACHAVNVKDK